MKKRQDTESGQSAILFALFLTVLIGCMAVVIDYGRPALIAARLQNAADSAALAAATKLSTKSESEVKSEALLYALENGFPDPTGVDMEITNSFKKVSVTVSKKVEYTFAGIFGRSEINLKRRASAELKALSGLRYTVPLSIEKTTMDEAIRNGNYFMTLKFGGGSGTNGAYGALDQDGSNGGGAADYSDRLLNGYAGLISVGDIIPTENGNMSGPTQTGVAGRYNACTHFSSSGGCTPDHYDVNCPRVMKIPIVTYVNTHSVRIEGFAAFLLDSYSGSGNECFVYGTYLDSVIIDGESDPDKDENPYGTYGIKLVE